MDMHFDGVIFQTHAAELGRRLPRNHPPYALLDVRPAAEYRAGHIAGARSCPSEALADGLPAGTDAATEFLVVGAGPTDPAVRAASLALGRHGARRRVEMPGGMAEWRAMGLPVVSGAEAAPAVA